MKIQLIKPEEAFIAGPYAPGIIAEGRVLFISGQGPYCIKEKRFLRGSVEEQTRLTLENLRRVVAAAAGNINQIVSCQVYLQQLTESSFKEMNLAYAAFFGEHKPTRTTVGCQLLNIDVEINAILAL